MHLKIPANRTINLTLLIILISLAGFCSTGTATSNHETISEGIATIYQNDIALAHDIALRNAQKNAIEKELGVLIESREITESAVWVKGDITATSSGMVSDYKILNKKIEGNTYILQIAAQVKKAELKSRAAELIENWQRPRLYSIIDYTRLNEQQDIFHNRIISNNNNFFIERGFSFTRSSNWQNKLTPPVTTDKIEDLKNQLSPDFDLLVFGKARCSFSDNKIMSQYGSSLKPVTLEAELVIYDIHTGHVIAENSELAAYSHINAASGCTLALDKKLMPAMSKSLYNQMLNKWQKSYSKGREFLLEIQGGIAYRQLDQFKKELRNKYRGVIDVIEKSYDSNKARLIVVYNGKASDFSQELTHKKSSLNYSVTSTRSTLFVIEVKP